MDEWADAKSTFHSISTIHVYSVQPTVLQDLNVLTDVGHEDSSAHAHEDPLEYGKQWGMIQNTNVKVLYCLIVLLRESNICAVSAENPCPATSARSYKSICSSHTNFAEGCGSSEKRDQEGG